MSYLELLPDPPPDQLVIGVSGTVLNTVMPPDPLSTGTSGLDIRSFCVHFKDTVI